MPEEYLPADQTIDPVAFVLNRLRTHLLWIEEHRSSFEANRKDNPDEAERELELLRSSTNEARSACAQFAKMILSGQTVDQTNRLPRDLKRLNDRHDQAVTLQNGDISLWTEPGSAIHLKCVTNYGDPVELNAEEARELCSVVERLIINIE